MKLSNTAVKAQLLERRRRLVQVQHSSAVEERFLLSEREPDPLDRGSDTTAAELLGRLGEKETREVARIDAALERMESGTWGHCTLCGEPIARERLLVMPETPHCLGCGREAALGAAAAAR
jgi:RNA polymerase-binding protein DksA